MARGIFSCGLGPLGCVMWDLVPSPGIEPRPPALGEWSFSQWTTKEIPVLFCFKSLYWAMIDIQNVLLNVNNVMNLEISIHFWNHHCNQCHYNIHHLQNYSLALLIKGSPVAQMIKNLPAMWEPRFNPWVGMIPWSREWLPTPVFLHREFHGQRSLVGYSPWDCKETDTTEWLSLHLLIN